MDTEESRKPDADPEDGLSDAHIRLMWRLQGANPHVRYVSTKGSWLRRTEARVERWFRRTVTRPLVNLLGDLLDGAPTPLQKKMVMVVLYSPAALMFICAICI